MRVLYLLYITTQQPASPPPPPPPAPAPAKRTVEFTGTVLMNGFYNSARTNNSDVPVFADTDVVGIPYSSARRGCFSRLRYAFLERWTLCEGVFKRPLTGAFGFGTRITTFSFSRLRLNCRRAPGSAWRDGARG